MDGLNTTNGARAAPMQSPCAAACRAVLVKHWMILAHMVMVNIEAMQIGQQAWGYGRGRQTRHGKADAEQAIQHNRPAGEAGRPLVSFRVGLEGVRWCRPL